MQQMMNKNTALDNISKIKNKALALVSQLDFCLNHYDSYQKTGSVFEKERTSNGIIDAEKNAEKITVLLREAPFDLGFPERQNDICENVQDAFSSEFGYTDEGFFYIKIPRLPTVKSNPADVKYFRDSVYSILSNAFVSGALQRFRFDKVVLVYRNLYASDVSKNRWSDNDNLEHRALTNLLSAFFLHDDNPEYCDCYLCSDPGSENCTEAYIIPKTKYIKFLKMRENNELNTIKLMSNPPA